MGLLVLTRQNAHTHTNIASQAYSLMQSTKESTVQHTMIYIVTLYDNLLKSKDKVAQISANLVYCYCVFFAIMTHYSLINY